MTTGQPVPTCSLTAPVDASPWMKLWTVSHAGPRGGRSQYQGVCSDGGGTRCPAGPSPPKSLCPKGTALVGVQGVEEHWSPCPRAPWSCCPRLLPQVPGCPQGGLAPEGGMHLPGTAPAWGRRVPHTPRASDVPSLCSGL